MDYLQKRQALNNSFKDNFHFFSIFEGRQYHVNQLSVPYQIQILRANRLRDDLQLFFTPIGAETPLCWKNSEIYETEKTSIKPDVTEFEFELHRHDYFELCYIFFGSVDQVIEGGRFSFRQGSFCLMNCNTQHAEIVDQDVVLIYVCLTREYVQQSILPYLPGGSPLSAFFQENVGRVCAGNKDYIRCDPVTLKNSEWMESLLNRITREELMGECGYQPIIQGLILRLLSYIQDPKNYSIEYTQLDSTSETELFAAVSRMMEKSSHSLSRAELSETLCYNGDYINRIVKKYSGMSIVQYNRSIQMKKAADLLCHTCTPITQIIQQLGYESRIHFYRAFEKKYKMSPSEYRRRFSAYSGKAGE